MKTLAFFGLVLSLLIPQAAYAFGSSDLAAADKLYAEKSWQMAASQYEKFLDEKADDALMREVAFKWSDCVLRGKDENNREKAEKNLREIIDGKDRDRWRTEAEVSLASDYIERDPYSEMQDIKKWLDDARDWWAGSSDTALARPKFIGISFQLADFITSRWGWNNADIRPIRLGGKSAVMPDPPQGNQSLVILFEEILKVAKTDDDKAHAHYGLAMSYMNHYSGEQKFRQKALDEFEKIIDDFSNTEWADDAYYQRGLFYENNNDFMKAVAAYRDLVSHFRRGDSQWADDASRRVEDITGPSLSLNVGNNFIPGSEIQFSMNWRNIKNVTLRFYQIDLASELRLKDDRTGYGGYQELLQTLVRSGRYKALPVALAADIDLKDEGKHLQHGEYKGLAEWRRVDDSGKADPKQGQLPAGAYLLVASGGAAEPAYDLVLVSDIALVSKIAKDMAVFMAMDAKTGKPVANADLAYTYSYYDGQGATRWIADNGRTDENGLMKTTLLSNSPRNYNQQHSVFAAVTSGGRQAFVQNNYYQQNYNNKGEWWLYAFTDRPVYRPNETVSFKGLLRQPKDGLFSSPAGMQVKARIYDAQGKQVKEGSYTLNDYGSFDDTLALDDKATLGEYRLQLYTADFNTDLSSVSLFRLEEYKLPEFVVNVKPEPKDDKAAIRAYRLGDTVDVTVDAQYYFGGPVADADVEYLVYQTPYQRFYRPERAYSWYYDDMYPQNYGYGGYGQLVKQEKIKTGKDGRAKFRIETPKDSGDLQYHVEVRVVDKSRREIRGTSDIKVTRTAFFASLEPKQNLYRPGDKAQVIIKTMTANDEPVAVEGKVTILRNTWREPVLQGDKVVNPAGYNGQEVFTKFVKTNERGEATFEFEPNGNGYYAVEFTGFDNDQTVTGGTNVFVCESSATNIGYRTSGLQIITEKDTYAVGETARAMIVSDVPDTYVMLTTENDNIYDIRMLHLEGSVKLVEIPVEANYTPNVFIQALSGANFQLKTASLQVIVPPAEKFLNVKVTSDKAVYQPQEEGVFDVEVTDKEGKPVSAEVAIGLTDAAVYYIQGEYAPDIRQFFYGDKRPLSIQTQTSFYQRPTALFVRDEAGNLITGDEKERRARAQNSPIDQLESDSDSKSMERGSFGGVLGAVSEGNFPTNAVSALGQKSDVLSEWRKAAPSPAYRMALKDKSEEMSEKKTAGMEASGKPSGEMQEPDRVRNDFRSTVVWLPSVVTDSAGRAQVKAKFPDSLTTWRLTARADTSQTAVGNVTHEVKSNKSLMIRLQAPRFFTERDLTDISALIDNMTDSPMTVQPELKTEGVTITGLYKDGKVVKGEMGTVDVPAHGQARVDWAVSAQKAGMARLTAVAKAEKMSDAMEKTYPVIPHGIEKFIARSLVLKSKEVGEATKELTFNIPKERIREATSLRLTVSPSLAANLLDALPYLADYPYGCVEQTMSRFLPAVVVRKTMRDLGLSAEDVEAYIGDVLEPRGDPQGHPQRSAGPTVSRLNKMTADSLTRLYDFQHGDGGWGWWKTGDSDRFMTAYVVWGLGLAHEAGMDVKGDVVSRAAEYLKNQLVEEEDAPDMLAWMLHGLSHADVSADPRMERQRSRLWDMRDKLNPYTRALFALSEYRRGDAERSRILAQNVINGVQEDKDNGTAHWGEAGVNYRWSEGGVEATAFSIKALANMDPQSEYLEKAVKWMILNRRGASWKNTRDTAIAILGLADYLKATRELAPDYDYIVLVNGKSVREGHADASNVFSFSRIIDIPAEALKDGDNSVKVVMKGRGALYVAAHAKYFTLEEPVTKAGNEIFVTREYFRQAVKETLMKGYTEDWTPLKDGDTVKSGDRIRVDVTLEAKNNYEYLIAEDYKPAGLEAVSLVSGAGEAITLDKDGRETSGRTPVYQEFRDQKAAFFIAKLKQGRHLMRYELRAEIPGEFHAMPDQAHAMYVPEIRSNSDEMRLNVGD
ncbi:MAG: MG2 domain-containing protein [Pseudomonadota bacterium]